MILSRIFQAIKWLLLLFLIWLVFIGFQIASFPAGSLKDKADVAIVLGAAVSVDKPSPVFKERIDHAINLYKRGHIQKIIFTGGLGENKAHAESLVVRNYALSLGVLKNDIFTEAESHTTRENFIQSQTLYKETGLNSALIITDPLHSKRSMLIAKDVGFATIKASATPTSRYKSWKTKIPFLLRELYFYHHYILFNE